MPSSFWETYWNDQSNHDWWKRPASEVMNLIRSVSPEQRPEMLDLGCGLGRHAIAFALAGFNVTATDSSETAIDHLNRWADDLRLNIRTKICDFLSDGYNPGTFDIVVSYNVIYHGYREDFAHAIQHTSDLLKPGGLFLFTCPTRNDGKYGVGQEVAPHTFLCTNSITPGDMHYFVDEQDLDKLLTDFQITSHQLNEGYWDNKGVQQFYSNWLVLAEKTRDI